MKKVLVIAALVAGFASLGGIAWATICGTVTLNSTYPLGVSMNGDGYFYNDITIVPGGSFTLTFGTVMGESTQVIDAWVRQDSGGSWVRIWDGNTAGYSVSGSSPTTFNFRSEHGNANYNGNLVVYMQPNGTYQKKRHFGWQNCVPGHDP